MTEQTSAWREISRTRVYDDFRQIDKVLYELPDGTQKYFDIDAAIGAVTIIALTTDQQLVMVRQYRPGPGLTLTEFPGGRVELGEEPAAAAARELLEETGYVGELTSIGRRHMDAYSEAQQHGFIATNCRKVAEPSLDEGEFLSVQLVSIAECRALIRSDDAPGAGMGFRGLDALGLL
jgi:ADP-ribose pyrophosphatase